MYESKVFEHDTFICDKCGFNLTEEKELHPTNGKYYEKNIGAFAPIEFESLGDKLVCRKCYEEYIKMVDNWFTGDLEEVIDSNYNNTETTCVSVVDLDQEEQKVDNETASMDSEVVEECDCETTLCDNDKCECKANTEEKPTLTVFDIKLDW
jgi:hypothetical protein